jgi:hypothetical protein
MMKRKSLDERLLRAADLAVRARVPLDLFDFLTRQSNIDAYEDVLIPHWDFFRFDRTAQEASFFLRINNLFTRRSDTDNLPRLLDELIALGAVDDNQAVQLQAMLQRVDSARKGVWSVRNKAIAHQDDTLSSPEVYAAAQLTLDHLKDLSDTALTVANALCSARGIGTRVFFTHPVESLKKLLQGLRSETTNPLDFLK